MTRYQNSTKCWSGGNRVRVWKSQPEQCGRASSILSPLQLMTADPTCCSTAGSAIIPDNYYSATMFRLSYMYTSLGK